jgi:hypothetical protein
MNDKKERVLSFQGQLCQVFQIAEDENVVVCSLLGRAVSVNPEFTF